jgi:hypothetical protein
MGGGVFNHPAQMSFPSMCNKIFTSLVGLGLTLLFLLLVLELFVVFACLSLRTWLNNALIRSVLTSRIFF